jgi:hypothetical protein
MRHGELMLVGGIFGRKSPQLISVAQYAKVNTLRYATRACHMQEMYEIASGNR